MDETQVLRLAREAIRQGDKAAAKRLLVRVVGRNPRSEIAWLWLSALETDRGGELHCLDKVLEINPNNEIAKRHKLRLTEQETRDDSEPAATTQISPEAPSSCPRCGAPTRPDVRFCPTCGGMLDYRRVCSRCGREGPWPEDDFNDATGQCTRCDTEMRGAEAVSPSVPEEMS